MLENIGISELLVILFVLFIFFGPKKLPTLGRSLGSGVKEFRKAMHSAQKDIQDSIKPD